MKTYSAAMQLELSRSTARLATCIRVERSDGNVYGFTTNSKVLTIGGIVYQPVASFIVSDLAAANSMDTDNQSAEALLSVAGLTEDELRAGRWDYAAYRRFQVNWAGLAAGDKKDSAGHLGQVTVNQQTFVADLLGLMEAYSTSIGELTSPGCRANLGDQRCKVDLTGTVGSPSQNLTVTGTIDSAVISGTNAYFQIADAARTEVADFFTEGVITFLSGIATGLAYEIKEYTVGVMVTKTPVAYDVTGASYSMHAGCMKRLIEDCVGRFDNGANFRGEPWLRGNDALVQIARRS